MQRSFIMFSKVKLNCIFTLLIGLFTADLCQAGVTHRIRAGCELIINGDWSKTQALILNENMTEIIHPNHGDTLLLGVTEKVVLACPGSQFVMKEDSEVVASCRRGTKVKVDDTEYDFKSMTCERPPRTSTRVVGKCLETVIDGIKIEIGFELENNFIKLIDVCFNNKTLGTVYSHYVATPKIVGRQRGVARPQFLDGGFYKDIEVSKQYTRYVQRKTIGDILGSEKLGSKYIQNNNLFYLARGHLTAKADFVYGSEQVGTFYYINAAPQWQIINAGNWERLEDSIRQHVVNTGLEISIYTLPYEIAVLPDVNENLTELYLYNSDPYDIDDYDYDINIEHQHDSLIPVPKFYIKILLDETTKKGISFVTINNPYLKKITDDYKICEDVCDRYPWLTWDQFNVKLGYSYCCSYEDLKGVVATLPDLPIMGLL